MLENPVQTSISCDSYKSGSEGSKSGEESVGESCGSVEKLFVHESDMVEDERDAEADLCHSAKKLFVHESDMVEEDRDAAEADICHSAGKLYVHESDMVEDELDADPDLCRSAGKLFVHENRMVEEEDHDVDPELCRSSEQLFVHEGDMAEEDCDADPELCRSAQNLFVHDTVEDEPQSADKLFVYESDEENAEADPGPEAGELELKVSSTLTPRDEQDTDYQEDEIDEKRNLEVALLSKTAEVEELVAQINSRECQMEALVQKFRDKERKDREADSIGKRRLAAEIREKEDDLEAVTQELLESREWARQKEEEIMILKEDLESSKVEEETVQSLIEENDALKAALKQEQKTRQAAEAEYLRLEEEHIITLKELSAERRKNSDWGNAAVCRVSKQITIDDLREELDSKETQLETSEAALAEALEMREKQWQQLWMLKEQELLSANDKILHQLADQRGEFAVIQGALRELEWSINRGEIDIKAKLAGISKKEGFVKVHTSHLEEVDQCILDLQTKLEDLQKKLEESEKRRKNAEVAASMRELKRVASFDLSLVQRNRDGHLTSHVALDNGMNGLRVRTRSSLGDKPGLSGFSCIREIQPETSWGVENSSGSGRQAGSISSTTGHGQPRDDYSLSVVPPVSPGRRQQKWLVDPAWLENVRKEPSSLRLSLESERHRASSFGQIGAEYRMIEAAVARAVEKHESEFKVLDLQQEVIIYRMNPGHPANLHVYHVTFVQQFHR